MRVIMKSYAILLIVICTVLMSGQAVAEKPLILKPNRVEISYTKPQNPAHQNIFELLKERRVLERFRDYLSPLRLPRTLLLKTEGCKGESNAWYEDSDHSVTVCYEYIEELQSNAPDKTTPGGVTPQDAVIGPLIEVFLHEVSHALFDLLKVPILGREEDAADQFAAYLMLRFDIDFARHTIAAVAYMYGREARSQKLELERFADVHGLSAQRLYNILCLAYGADQKLFADVVEKGYLPKSRAEGCADEYKQIYYAVEKLIYPNIDEAVRKKVQPKKLLRPVAQK
ncbi:MAG TPA: hypothetical protein DDZ40_12245 [Deltaproteobacteria bacterium]|nr:hypothetical protein [Deltaproteobacteria bacterium]